MELIIHYWYLKVLRKFTIKFMSKAINPTLQIRTNKAIVSIESITRDLQLLIIRAFPKIKLLLEKRTNLSQSR